MPSYEGGVHGKSSKIILALGLINSLNFSGLLSIDFFEIQFNGGF